MAPEQPLEVWYDGQCPLCRASRDWCEARDAKGRLVFRDLTAATAAELPVPRDEAAASMWVRGDDGTLASGFAGWRRILAELPGWSWLARLTGVPPLSWLGPGAYRLIARGRNLARGRVGHGHADGHGDGHADSALP